MIVYTACNTRYIPGAIALHNSFRRHCRGRFVVLFDGDDPSPLESRGMEVVVRPDSGLPVIPKTENRPDHTAAVHCYRFAIPELAEGDRAIYIDADALIVQDLQPLFDLAFDEPVAATLSNSPIEKEITGPGAPRGLTGFISSLMIFNIPEWHRQGVMEACRRALMQSLSFKTGDQALLNYALLNNWHRLPIETQCHVGHDTIRLYPPEKVFLWHFLGTNPWEEVPQELLDIDPRYAPGGSKQVARQEWRKYYDLHLDV